MKKIVLERMPRDAEKFYHFITATDDLQKSIDVTGFTMYAMKADGRIDFDNKEAQKEIKNEPMCRRWDWTDEESRMWSKFRNEYDDLYKKFHAHGGAKDEKLKKQVDQFIGDCIVYEQEHLLVDRVANSMHAPQVQMRTFNIKQDKKEYKTPFRTITIYHESRQPFKKEEENFIKKYIALHEHCTEISERLKKHRSDIKNLYPPLRELWEKLPIIKDKLDKALNQIFLPPPRMMGQFSDVVSFYVPTAEESQQYADDFNESFEVFQKEVMDLWKRTDKVYTDVIWAHKGIFDNSTGEYTDRAFEEVDQLLDKVAHHLDGSIDTLALDDEYQDYLGAKGDMMDEADKAGDEWEEFVHEQGVFVKVYNAFTGFLTDKLSRQNEQAENPPVNENNPGPGETDELRAETISRYESDLKNNTHTYFDIDDWHIIFDHYKKEKHDEKNYKIAMERAREQHPDAPSVLISQAYDEAGEHRYQQALDLLKKVEDQGGNLHPNFYTAKAYIYCQLQTPDLAIPIYQRLARQEGKELQWWRRFSYDRLIEIFAGKKNYAESIRLLRELITEEPDNETLVSNLAHYLSLNNQTEEAEKELKDFLEKHPGSAICEERMGHIYFNMKEFEKAIEHYDRAFNIDKQGYYEAIFNKGNALMELKKFSEAATCFELCIFYFKPGKEYHLKAAECYRKLKLDHVAVAHYRKVLAVEMENGDALKGLEELNKQALQNESQKQ